jgi:hypothetical protein
MRCSDSASSDSADYFQGRFRETLQLSQILPMDGQDFLVDLEHKVRLSKVDSIKDDTNLCFANKSIVVSVMILSSVTFSVRFSWAGS